MQPNPNPSIKQQQESVSIIEELKAAGEEIKRAERESERSSPSSKQSSGHGAPELPKATRCPVALNRVAFGDSGSGQAPLEVDPVRDYKDSKKEQREQISNGVDGPESKHQESRPLTGQAGPKKAGIGKSLPAPSSMSIIEGKKGWVSLEDYQKAILQEKQRMKEAYKQIEALERKVREKLEMIEKVEVQTERINKALSELNQKIVSIKKEDDTLLYQIREKLGDEQRIKNSKKNLGE